MKPVVSIIVPNYQGRAIFPKCIRSLLQQDFKEIQIVFVDDGSSDGSYAHAKELFGRESRVTITRTPKNSGYVGACNHAFKSCKGEYVIVTNNDATFAKDWVSEMYRAVKGKEKVLGASMVFNSKEEEQAIKKQIAAGKYGVWSLVGMGRGWRKLTNEEKKSGLVEVHCGGVLIIPRKALSDYIFAKDYFAYGEDIELCWRLRLKGYHVVTNTKSYMYHYDGGSYTRKHVPAFSKRATMHGTKNRITNFLVFYETKNFVALSPPFFLIELIVFIARGIRRPGTVPLHLQSYWYVFSHLRQIMKRRREYQQGRTVNDKQIMELCSYKIDHEAFVKSTWHKLVIRLCNACMRVYCKCWGIRTYDSKNENATPAVEKSVVR